MKIEKVAHAASSPQVLRVKESRMELDRLQNVISALPSNLKNNAAVEFKKIQVRLAQLENDLKVAEVIQGNIKSELSKSDKLIDTLFHTSDVGIVIVDSRGILIRVNNGLCKLLGFNQDELIGKSFFQIIISSERREARAAHKQFSEGQNKNYEVKILCKQGGFIDCYITANIFTDDNGNKFIVKTIRDISQRKKIEFELEQLSWVASHTSNAVIISDKRGNVKWANSSFEKLTGYKLNEIKGQFPEGIIKGAQADKETLNRISEKLRRKEQSTGEVLLYNTKQGKPIWMTSDITPIFKSGKLINYIGIMTDITDLIEAKELQREKESLTRSEQLLNAIAENFPGGIIGVLDNDMNCIFKGGSELVRIGYTGQDFGGNKLFNYLTSESGINAEEYLKRAFRGDSTSFEVKLKNNIYSVTIVPLHLSNETVLKVLAVIQNITERKKAEEETLRALKQQQELNELKSKFVSIASHEFRTPLTTILSSVFLISQYDKPGDEEKKSKHLSKIRDSVANLTDILNDFLSLGKIEEGGVTSNPEVFDAVDFCIDLMNEMTTSLKEGQKIIFDRNENAGEIYADKKHLKHVLTNLISNAIKYSTEGTNIFFEMNSGNDTVIFSVKDQGIGIPDDDQVHLFETFFRAKNAGNIQGTGMGLHIVKKYLDLMGGIITFNSRLGEGSTFTVKFQKAGLKVATNH